jgi:hypothetical protein
MQGMIIRMDFCRLIFYRIVFEAFKTQDFEAKFLKSVYFDYVALRNLAMPKVPH